VNKWTIDVLRSLLLEQQQHVLHVGRYPVSVLTAEEYARRHDYHGQPCEPPMYGTCPFRCGAYGTAVHRVTALERALAELDPKPAKAKP
jgi:hypothetical protein